MATKPVNSEGISGFRAHFVYEDTVAPRRVAESVRVLHEERRRRLARRSALGWGCLAGFVLGPLLLLIGANIEQGALMAAGATALVAGITLAVMRSRCRPFDAARIDTLERLAGLLATDMAPDAALRVRLDLQRVDHQSKLERTGSVGPWKVRYFTDPWLRLGGRLLDGTAFQLSLVTAHQDRSKTKRSASGKTKTKRKTKQSMRARLRLQVKPERYPGLATVLQQRGNDGVARMAEEIRLPRPAQIAGLDVTAEALDLSARLGPVNADAAPAHHAAAMMFLGLYRVLNFVRANDKPQRPGGDA